MERALCPRRSSCWRFQLFSVEMCASSHRAVTHLIDHLTAPTCLYLVVGPTPTTGQNRDKPWFLRFGLRTNLTEGKMRALGVWPCQHILASKGP